MKDKNYKWISFLFILGLITHNLAYSSEYSKALYKNDPDSVKQRKEAIKRYGLNKTSQYYQVLADRYKNNHDFQNAIKNYSYALLLNNDSGYCLLQLGEIYFKQGLYEESSAYLKNAFHKSFEFHYDQLRSQYLLTINYFFQHREQEALNILYIIVQDYQEMLDRNVGNSNISDTQYYAPAFFLINLYNRNNHLFKNANNLKYLQKSLNLNYKKEYINYFFYEYYKSQNLLSIAFEYLTQAKMIDINIEEHVRSQSWIKDYNIF